MSGFKKNADKNAFELIKDGAKTERFVFIMCVHHRRISLEPELETIKEEDEIKEDGKKTENKGSTEH
ncbi:unnamed protein product [Caenorhabditis sp. 36 PRJEB53466]|nr:unnamed protein product [Caenorhabditis sp. 36 PRJEB53466]